ncbi:MAG: UDP-3-O-(3-hydroxymyristoyl)glucosamine N-acyltransferase [Nitrospirota bacterium]
MIKKLKELAELVGGSVIGNGDIDIKGISGIREADEGDITFIAHTKYLPDLEKTRATAVIIGEKILDSRLPGLAPLHRILRRSGAGQTPDFRLTLLKVKNPYFAFSKILELFSKRPYHPTGISNKALIGEGCSLGKDISVHPYVALEERVSIRDRVTLFPGVYIGKGSEIGEDSIIYPNVSIREDIKIGKRVIIHSGTVIGSDGFGFVEEGGRYHKIPQVGNILIEDDVEIGANCTIDRATLGTTIIRKGTKIDNLVHIAHNVIIGEDSIILAQVGISGSTEIGKHVILAGQAGIADHIKIGDNVVVIAQSGVGHDIEPNQVISGTLAIPHKDWLKAQAIFSKLPEIRKKITDLEERIKRLEGINSKGGRNGHQGNS